MPDTSPDGVTVAIDVLLDCQVALLVTLVELPFEEIAVALNWPETSTLSPVPDTVTVVVVGVAFEVVGEVGAAGEDEPLHEIRKTTAATTAQNAVSRRMVPSLGGCALVFE